MPLTGAVGSAGELRVAGQSAASITDWSAEPAPGGWHIRASLAEVADLYLNSGAPVEVRLNIGRRIWRWRNVRVERTGPAATITATGDFEQL